jgi:hypothetical protein
MLVLKTAESQCFFSRVETDRLSDQQVLDGVIDLLLNGVLARPAGAEA